MKPVFYWHVSSNILIEPLLVSSETIINYISVCVPKNKIKLRLQLLKPVKGKLPAELIKSGKIYCETHEVYFKTKDASIEKEKIYFQAEKIYYKTLEKYKKELKTLHKIECPGCSWNGKNI